MKITGLLSFMLGATETTNGPEVAPAGMVMLMDASAPGVDGHRSSVQQHDAASLGRAKIQAIDRDLTPDGSGVAETLVITGAGAAVEFTETLSNVAVVKAVVLPLFTARPT